jgi:hypothetical protein
MMVRVLTCHEKDHHIGGHREVITGNVMHGDHRQCRDVLPMSCTVIAGNVMHGETNNFLYGAAHRPCQICGTYSTRSSTSKLPLL